MRIFIRVVVVGVLSLISLGAAAGTEAINWSYRYGLVTFNDDHSIRLMNMMRDYAEDLDTETTDVVAELLAQRHSDKEYSEKLIIWYGRVLEANKRNRYSSVLEEVSATIANQELSEDFEKISKRLSKLKEKEEQYVKGMLSIGAIKAGYIAAAENAVNTDIPEKMIKLKELRKKKVTPTVVFDTLGNPQHLRFGGLYRITGLQFYYYYKDTGLTRFTFRRRKGFELDEIDLDSLSYQLDMPYYSLTDREIDETLALNMLKSEKYKANQNIMIHYVDLDYVPSLQFLETSAEKLSNYIDSGDAQHEERIYNWIVKLLVKHGLGRYQELLQKVASMPQSRLSDLAKEGLAVK
ncbi:hypothetical protein NBRC116494_30280 [Aurantivibrio plasticivorans]